MRLPSALESYLQREGPIQEFLWFGFKQAWACIFGALLLAGLIGTSIWYPEGGLHRYDFLFLYAVAIQGALLLLKLETLRECGVVILFHVLATIMELFKTSESIGSWSYPGDAVIQIGNVPLFAGFMYSAVGSYMARIWRIFQFRFEHFPALWIAATLALLSYVNFFTHHYFVDIRWWLIVGVVVAYVRTRVCFTPMNHQRSMSLLLGFLLVSFFLWIAENLGTVTKTWIYPDQVTAWKLVGFGKFTAWFLLMQLSFVLIYGLRKIEKRMCPAHD